MGMDVMIYLEGKRKNDEKYINLSPFYSTNSIDKETKYYIATIINGRRAMYNALRNLSSFYSLDGEISKEVKNALTSDFYGEEYPWKEVEKNIYIIHNLNELEKMATRKKTKGVIVAKNEIDDFKNGEIEYFEDIISPQEYMSLEGAAREYYQYYEWEEIDDFTCQYKAIYNAINTVLDQVNTVSRGDWFNIEDCRLIIYVSY